MENNLNKVVNGNVRKLLMDSGITLTQMGKDMGIAQRTVYKHFSGSYDFRMSQLEWLADYFGVEVNTPFVVNGD